MGCVSDDADVFTVLVFALGHEEGVVVAINRIVALRATLLQLACK